MFKKMLFCAAAGLLLLAQSACDNDKPQPTPSAQKGSTLITTTVVNPDGASGVCYMQLIDGLTGHYDNAKAVPAGFGAPPVVQGRDVFVLPDYMGNNKAEMRHYVYETNGTLQLRGTLALPAGAGAANVCKVSDTKAYVSFQNTGQVWAFNPSTMQKIAEIDMNALAQKDMRVAPAAMVARDGLLFVGLNQFDAQWMPTAKQADMAVVDTKTDKVVKKISDTKHELSFATRPIDPHSVFVDAQGDIYVNCMGSFGYKPGFTGGLLRIRKGQTDFDPDFVINYQTAKVQGFDGAIDYVGTVRLASDGKVYAMAANFALDPNNKNPYLAKVMFPVVIDLQQRSVQKIDGIPYSNGHAVAIGERDGKLYFGSGNDEAYGFYAYNLKTKKSEGLAFSVVGMPSQFEALK